MVLEKTSPVTEIIAPAIVESTLRAPSMSPGKSRGTCRATRVESTCGSSRPRPTAPSAHSDGTTQNGRKRPWSHQRPREDWGCTNGAEVGRTLVRGTPHPYTTGPCPGEATGSRARVGPP